MFGAATLTNCTLTANTAQGGNGSGFGGDGGSGYGAAIFNLDGQLSLTFSTVALNTVTAGTGSSKGNAAGGAVYNLAFGNDINTGGAQAATATITDSILSNSTGGKDLVNNVVNGKSTNTATVTLNGPNLVITSSGTIGGTMPLTGDPQLGPLQNNGGPTPTMAIPPSSPGFQAGTPVPGVTTDQRRLPRPASGIDLGAFQTQPPQPPPPPAPAPGPGPGPVQDVTSLVSIQRGKLRRRGGRYWQTITLHNAGAPLQGPLYLVVDQLTRKVQLRQPAGRSLHAAPSGSPYVLVSLGDNMLGTGETLTVVLTFSNPLGRKIRYGLRLLDGSGPP
jgi:hypothetical protein